MLRISSHHKLCAGFDKECGALFEVARPRVTLNAQKTNFRQGGGLRNSSHHKLCAGFDKECGALFEVT
jgi:hypothetical protein